MTMNTTTIEIPQNIQVPNGYKQTSVGIIPEDWKIKKVKEILLQAKLGGNYENSESNIGIPVVKMGNINRGNINIDKLQNLPLNENYNEDDILKEGDLLFNTRNTLDLVGKVAIWKNELPFALYNSNLLRLKFKDEFVSSNYYMNYLFNASRSLSQLRGFATGTTSVAAIYSRDLEHLKFALPPHLEQQKIADILSTWDKAIVTCKNTIENLKLRNKGLAQQLLTGKTRVKGFEAKWKMMELNQCLTYTPREIEKPKENFLALGIRSHGKGIFHKPDFDPAAIAMEKLFVTKENDLIVNITFAWEQAVAIISKADEGGLVSHRFPTYTFKNEKASPRFFRYFILEKRFKFLLELISPGGAGRNRVMSKTDFLKLELKLPSVQEQESIANILDTANAELKQYEQKLLALQLQKKGLMQELLTGKTRVKV